MKVKVRVQSIDWSKEQPPNPECSYDHVIGKTPLGDFLIVWKGWKESPSYDVEHPTLDSHLYGFGCLLEAQNAARKRYNDVVMSCIELIF